MRTERLLFLALAATFSLALSATAVAADGDDRVFERVASVPAGEAIVYIYRQRKGAGSIAPIGFDVNDSLTGALWSGRYETVAVPVGSVRVRARGIDSVRIKCIAVDKLWWTQWFAKIGKSSLSYLGVYGGPKWETTFNAEAGKEYFVEVAPGLRVNFHSEAAPMKHKVTTLKRSKRLNVFLSKSQAEQAVQEVEKDCAESRLTDAYRSTIKTPGPRIVD